MQTSALKSTPRATEPPTDDFVAVALAFAEEALEDRKRQRHGRWIRLAARRFIRDLKRAQGKNPPFYWSPAQANRACRFIEEMPHVEGKWDSPTIVLTPAQVFCIAQLFGFRNLKGGRRFTEFLYLVARKNAKSTLVAAILLYCMCEEDEPGAQVVAAATTGDQARIVWNIAKQMIDRLPDLREFYGVEAFAKSIVRYPIGGSFRAINAKASTQDGLNPSATSLDEIHAHKTHDLLNVLRSAAGARENALWLYPTTEGYESPGPWPELRNMAEQILERVLVAEHFLAIIFAADDDDDDFSERAVRKANPLYDYSPVLREKIAQLQITARAMPGTLGEYRIKRLNRRSTNAKALIDLRKWRRCSGPVPLEALVGRPCWGGLDLASTTDMVAWALLWFVDDVYYARVRYWVPAAAVASRTERRSVGYAGWVEQGFVEQTDGDVVDYDVIERAIAEDYGVFQPRVIGYDPWNAQDLCNRLVEQQLPLMLFRQGPASYHPAIQEFERAYLSRRLRHGGHPVLTWNAANLVPRYDANMNAAPDRKRSREKIDGICALLEAFGVSLLQNDEGDFAEFLKRPAHA